uniref:Uncharacterized protein n=1 Tax=Arundo donax TaxID=35708 RepID=A0A0A9A3E7_ARUDO
MPDRSDQTCSSTWRQHGWFCCRSGKAACCCWRCCWNCCSSGLIPRGFYRGRHGHGWIYWSCCCA